MPAHEPKEITRTGTAMDRYLTAFETNALDPALLQDRLAALRAKTTQLQSRHDELAELLDHAPVMPSDDELDALADQSTRSSTTAPQPNARP